VDRPNLSLYSQNMPVKVDVWVIERKGVDGITGEDVRSEHRRVIAEVKSSNAPVRVRLVSALRTASANPIS
jgi:hypothetical protein